MFSDKEVSIVKLERFDNIRASAQMYFVENIEASDSACHN